jgi:ATP-binding cassette subfamily C exporter for protease/lipase
MLSMVPLRPESMALPAPMGYLQVDGLIAGAPGSPVPILRGVSFSLQPGDVLAVVGPSASGKTTLARLLVGLWPAINGKVRLDGVDVFTWDKLELGPHIGYLPQGVELFDGSTAENIARFGELDQAKVETAARMIGLHEFIMSLPQGYNSPVGREGTMLSGGQRQRVGLARAIYASPAFVVLDEPNSSLDEQGDADLALAITQLKAMGTTFIVTTHRTSVLECGQQDARAARWSAADVWPSRRCLEALAEATAAAKASQGAVVVPANA